MGGHRSKPERYDGDGFSDTHNKAFLEEIKRREESEIIREVETDEIRFVRQVSNLEAPVKLEKR